MEANFVAMFEGKWAEKVEITDKLFLAQLYTPAESSLHAFPGTFVVDKH